MSTDNNENISKMINTFMQKTNFVNRFQIFTKRTHYILLGISVFTACYTTFSFYIHKNIIKLERNMDNLKNYIRYDINDTREKHNEILEKIEKIISNIEEQDEKLDEYKNAIYVQNASSLSDASTQTDEEHKTYQDDIHHNELDNECYDIIPCNNIKKHHFI